MRASNVISLYRLRLRAMVVQEMLAMTGIAIGVALVFAALIANTSLTGSMRELTAGVMGKADFQVASRSSEGFDERLLGRIRRLSGVEAAVPILDVKANLTGPGGRRPVVLLGGNGSFSELAGDLETGFSAGLARQRAIALPTPLAVDLGLLLGQSVGVEIDRRIVDVPLGVQLQKRDIGGLIENPIALTPLAYAQQIARRPERLTRIFVRAEPGRQDGVFAELRALVGNRLNIGPADEDRVLFEQAAYPTSQSTMLFSVLSALVGFLFAFSAVLLTVPQRSRLVADLRMAGYEGPTLVQLLLFDALVLGAVASVAGLLLGDQLSRHLFDSTPGYLAAAFPVGSQRIVTPQSIAIASASGFLAACLAVLVPLRRVLTRHPLGDLSSRPGRIAPLVGAVGVVCFAITTVVIVAVPDAAIIGLVTLTIALMCLLPAVLWMGTKLVALLTRGWKTPVPTLAILELRSRETRSRAVALVATGALAVFATVSIGGANADLERGLDNSARTLDSNADIWVTLTGSTNALATTQFDSGSAFTTRVRQIPGVKEVGLYRGGFLDVGDHRAWVIAMPRAAAAPLAESQIVRGRAPEANDRLRAGGWVVLSESIADEMGASVGDAVMLPSPVPRRLRVAAIANNLGWPPGAVVLNADDYTDAWGTEAVSGIHAELAAGASPTTVKRAIERDAVSGMPFDVETTAERIARHDGTAEDGLARLGQISVLVVIAAVLAMAVTLAGMVWQRRATFAHLKVSGFSQRDLWSTLMMEGGTLLGIGCITGAIAGLYGQLLLSRALASITGFPVSYVIAIPTVFVTLALLTSVVLAMLILPGWLAVRVRPSPGPAT